MTLQRISMTLEEFNEYIKGKNIIILGNALGALDKYLGEMIDSYDIVLRFGKGIPSKSIYKNIGQRTDIWVTGELRMHEHHRLPEGCKILFNNSKYNPEKGKPFDDYLEMYSYATIRDLQRQYKVGKYLSLSAGAITSHWLANVATGWKSLTWVNFNIFTAATKIWNPVAQGNTFSTSWHLPLIKKKFVDRGYNFLKEGDISHDSKAEIRMYEEILEKPNTTWLGEFPTGKTLSLLGRPRALWKDRVPIEK